MRQEVKNIITMLEILFLGKVLGLSLGLLRDNSGPFFPYGSKAWDSRLFSHFFVNSNHVAYSGVCVVHSN